MSSPLSSIKKSKRPPLFLPEMTTPTPTPNMSSAYNLNNLNPSPSEKLFDYNDNETPSPRFSFSNGYSKNALLSNRKSSNLTNSNSNEHVFSLHRNNLLEEIPSSRVPFKTQIDDSDLIDEATTKMAVNNLKKHLPVNKGSNEKNIPNDMELMQIMMSKIKRTESRCAILEKESRDKDRQIKILEEKLSLYKKANIQSRDDVIEDLEKKNLKLQNQIDEMENFLSDYGLYWVGEKDKGTENPLLDINEEDNGKNNTKPQNYLTSKPSKNDAQFSCNYDLIVKNIKDLNSLVESNETKIVEFNDNKAKFETSETVKLTLYSNGIALYNGPFRPFTDSITKKFCIDIMDGYFPSELQEKYPDGVSFELVDKREIYFKEEKNSVFKSKGYRLGSGRIQTDDSTISSRIDSLKQEESDNRNIESQLLENPLTVEQFLNKLPTCVIRNGKVLDVRSDLSNIIKGKETKIDNTESNPKLEETKTLNEHYDKNQEQNENSLKPNETKIATLKIRSINGENAFLVKMKYTDTIQNLKDHIKSQKKLKFVYKDFDLASVHPRKIFDNTKLTLEECDLVPNSNIILIPRKK